MEEETELLFNKASKTSSPVKDRLELSLEVLKKCHSALRRRILRKAIMAVNGNLKKISLKHIDDAIKLVLADTQGDSIDLPNQIRIFKKEKSLFIKKESVPLRELGRKKKSQRNL
jgi:tRNA(Ile)-lysidine synthase